MKHVRLILKNEELEGILVTEDEKHVVLKLSSGYNIGIARVKIERIEVLEEKTSSKDRPREHAQDNDLPKVLILHTGGTIASKVDYQTGAVSAKFSPSELLDLFPELKDLAHIESKLFRNMMSDDMRFAHYNLIAKEIHEEWKKNPHLKGIIITHGTDTLHYTSAALSFIFEHLSIPVVLVGSQRSSDRGSSDSATNIISAVTFIANTSLKGVFICMHENLSDETCVILNGINARKMHSSRRDAFKQINGRPIASVNHQTREIDYLSEYPSSPLTQQGQFQLHLFDEHLKIGIVTSHPNMHPEEFEVFSKGFNGLIIEGTGLGHLPISKIDEFTAVHLEIKRSIETLCKKIPVVMTVQTIYGRVNMNVYSPGRELIDAGVIGTQSSLSPETAFIKLAWIVSQRLDAKEYFMQDLRGEYAVKDQDFE